MTAHEIKDRVFIALLVISNTIGNLFLALGMKQMPDFDAAPMWSYIGAFLTNFWIIAGVVLLIFWLVAQLSMFTWADLSYVLPVTASAYIFTAILGKFFMSDRISPARWAGIFLISVGVMLVAATPECTRKHGDSGERP